MNPPVFLSGPEPLSAQVAAHLLAGRSGNPPDLGDTLVIVPTAGAARAIRAELARQSHGVLSPRFQLPMEALLPDNAKTASPLERLAAWVKVLPDTPRAKFAALVPPAVKLSTPEDWLGVATRLIDVGNALAEAALDPSSARLTELCPQDASRWQELGKLYTTYQQILERAERPDPNAVRLQQSAKPTLAPGLRRIVIAAVPDLPKITTDWLTATQDQGVAVEILCASAADNDARLDPWGRPDPEWWATHPVQVSEGLPVIENDVAGEASALVEFAALHGKKGFALISAAPESTAALEAEVARRGAVPYLPEGQSLAQTEAATILITWDDFLRHQRLRTLRPLLQLPVFAELLLAGSELGANEAAAACDRLLAEKLCPSLEAARNGRPPITRPGTRTPLNSANLSRSSTLSPLGKSQAANFSPRSNKMSKTTKHPPLPPWKLWSRLSMIPPSPRFSAIFRPIGNKPCISVRSKTFASSPPPRKMLWKFSVGLKPCGRTLPFSVSPVAAKAPCLRG